MRLFISEQAAAWYKKEMALSEGDHVRFYVRYGGFSTIQPGFSLGVSKDTPENPGAETVVDGIHFYIEKEDLWYFNNQDFYIELNPQLEEPDFNIAS